MAQFTESVSSKRRDLDLVDQSNNCEQVAKKLKLLSQQDQLSHLQDEITNQSKELFNQREMINELQREIEFLKQTSSNKVHTQSVTSQTVFSSISSSSSASSSSIGAVQSQKNLPQNTQPVSAGIEHKKRQCASGHGGSTKITEGDNKIMKGLKQHVFSLASSSSTRAIQSQERLPEKIQPILAEIAHKKRLSFLAKIASTSTSSSSSASSSSTRVTQSQVSLPETMQIVLAQIKNWNSNKQALLQSMKEAREQYLNGSFITPNNQQFLITCLKEVRKKNKQINDLNDISKKIMNINLDELQNEPTITDELRNYTHDLLLSVSPKNKKKFDERQRFINFYKSEYYNIELSDGMLDILQDKKLIERISDSCRQLLDLKSNDPKINEAFCYFLMVKIENHLNNNGYFNSTNLDSMLEKFLNKTIYQINDSNVDQKFKSKLNDLLTDKINLSFKHQYALQYNNVMLEDSMLQKLRENDLRITGGDVTETLTNEKKSNDPEKNEAFCYFIMGKLNIRIQEKNYHPSYYDILVSILKNFLDKTIYQINDSNVDQKFKRRFNSIILMLLSRKISSHFKSISPQTFNNVFNELKKQLEEVPNKKLIGSDRFKLTLLFSCLRSGNKEQFSYTQMNQFSQTIYQKSLKDLKNEIDSNDNPNQWKFNDKAQNKLSNEIKKALNKTQEEDKSTLVDRTSEADALHASVHIEKTLTRTPEEDKSTLVDRTSEANALDESANSSIKNEIKDGCFIL